MKNVVFHQLGNRGTMIELRAENIFDVHLLEFLSTLL
jgi:hypothetical protein